MIAFADNLPLVRLADKRAIKYERAWLERAVAEAAEEAGYDVGHALPRALSVLVAGGIREVVDDRRRHQRLQQADDGQRDRVGENDA